MVHGDFALCGSMDDDVIAFTRSCQQETLLAVHNFSKEPQILCDARIAERSGEVLLSNYEKHDIAAGEIHLKPYETLILKMNGVSAQ
jgi:glycosidase